MSTALLVTNLVPLPQSGGLGALWQEATVHSSLHLDYPCQAGEIGSLLSSCLGLSYPPPHILLEAVRPLPVFFPTLAHRLQLPSPAGFLYP